MSSGVFYWPIFACGLFFWAIAAVSGWQEYGNLGGFLAGILFMAPAAILWPIRRIRL